MFNRTSFFQVLYNILREVGEDFRAVAKTKISDIARGDSKSHLTHSTLAKANFSQGMSLPKHLFNERGKQSQFRHVLVVLMGILCAAIN